MKKNLLTVFILALVLCNFVLTAILVFSIVPVMNKTNTLITKICNMVDLEVKGVTKEEGTSIESVEVYDIADQMTINLKKGEDGKDHYAVLSISLSLDKENADYKTYNAETIAEKESLIKNEIINVVSGYTIDEVKGNTVALQADLLEHLQTLFDSNVITEVAFRDAIFQ